MEDQILTYALVEMLLQDIEERWPTLKPETKKVWDSIPEGLRTSTDKVTPEVEGAFNELAKSSVMHDIGCIFAAEDCWPIWRARGGGAKS